MIAKVRIAPVERWCEEAKGLVTCGQIVEIIPSSMRLNVNGFREWQVSEETKKTIVKAGAGRFHGQSRFYICEHVLEMD